VPDDRIRIATRGSDLALWQARHVASRLEAALGVATELVPFRTTGDRIQSVSLAKIGGKGLFVKEIEAALLDGRADLAVHSAKDLPAPEPDDLVLVAFPERGDPRDALVRADGAAQGIDGLRRGARVGTGSTRRRAQLLLRRPDLEVSGLRGNVATRLRKLSDQGLDAVVLACAGLDRLELAERASHRLTPDELLPAIGQGALAVQMRARDPRREAVAGALDHAPTAGAVAAERGFLKRLGGDCTTPLAAYAEVDGDGRLALRGMVIAPDGDRVAQGATEGGVDQAESLGARLAERLLAEGGQAILAELRTGPPG